jgi:hypothetical protein
MLCLQVKLTVAAQKNNPKVFMWSSQWEAAAARLPEQDLFPPDMEEGREGGGGGQDLFPPDMETLLGGVGEERREEGRGEEGENTTSDNLNSNQSLEHGGELFKIVCKLCV